MSTLALPAPNLGNFQQRAPWEQAALSYLGSLKNPNTKRQYTQHLENYLYWCSSANVDPMTAVKGQVQMYLTWLEDPKQNGGKGYSESTIASYWTVVDGFYRTAENDDVILKSPTRAIKKPTVDKDKQHRPYLPPMAFAQLMKVSRTRLSPREHAIIATLGYQALRISEACNLDVRSMSNTHGHRVLVYVGKGGKLHEQDMAAELCWALDRWLDGRELGPMLLNARGNRLTRRNASDLIQKLMAMAFQDEEFNRMTPHAMRRSFATYGLSNGVSLDEMCETLGHSDSRTTRIYDRNAGHRGRDKRQGIVAHMSMQG